MSATRIPKILHFCFGLSPRGGDWGLAHYVCVRSAVERIKPDRAFFYFEYEPRGPFWDLTTRIVECQRITAPRRIFGNPLVHFAHRADVLRLEKLIELGGIYLDCDVFVHRDFDDLLDSSVVMGREGEEETVGLCNAVILAEPGAPFLRRWYSHYESFRSKGHDLFWNEHSVLLPLKLAQTYPDELKILGPRAFFWPPPSEAGLKRLFASDEPIAGEGVYANHLWESGVWAEYLRDLTPARVRMVPSNFHHWARPFVADLPDNFGAPSLVNRVLGKIVSDQPSRWKKKLRQEAKIRQIKAALRNSHPLIDRAVHKRHEYIDRGFTAISTVAAKKLGSRANLLTDLHRRHVFRSVYRHFTWGGDGESVFYSGAGSRGEHARLYVEAMVPLLARHASQSSTGLVIVDLGCGDFAIGAELLKALETVRYIGCDIVPELIAYNQYRFGDERIGFQQIDIVRDSLPDGDVCFVRQVLQHLSNAEIAAVLPKLAKYRYVYVSEHLPVRPEGVPNPDKKVGADVRFDWSTGRGRGVELDLPPWNLALQEIIRTTGAGNRNEMVVTHKILSFNQGQKSGRPAEAAASV